MARERSGPLSSLAAGRDNHFNLIRLLAAMGVMISHAFIITGGRDAPQPFQSFLYGTTIGTVSVYAFFTISGFLICRSYLDHPDLRRFLLHRAARIMPALIAVTLLSLALGAALTTDPGALASYAPEFVARNLTLIGKDQAMPGVFTANPFGPTVNAPLWSLPYEAGCYLALLVAGVLGLLRYRLTLLLLAVILIPLLIANFLGAFDDKNSREMTRFQIALTYGAFFLIGALLWLWRDRITLHFGIFAGLWLAVLFGQQTIVFFPVFLTSAIAYSVIYLAYLPAPGLLRFNRLGDYSYGTYLFGFPIQQLVEYSTAGGSPGLNIAISVPVTLMLGVLSWHLIEARSLRAARRISGPLPAVAPR